jgi:hypothetical protein
MITMSLVFSLSPIHWLDFENLDPGMFHLYGTAVWTLSCMLECFDHSVPAYWNILSSVLPMGWNTPTTVFQVTGMFRPQCSCVMEHVDLCVPGHWNASTMVFQCTGTWQPECSNSLERFHLGVPVSWNK